MDQERCETSYPSIEEGQVIVCPVCGKQVTVEEGYKLLDDNNVIHASCPWAEGEQKAAAPANERSKQDGER